MTETTIAPGLLIDARYRISALIADGGMATVYAATDERLDRTVAIKVMHTQLAQGPQHDQFVERFHREARSAAAIANPHIVQVYDTGTWGGLNFLVMEYVHGVNLRQEMNSQHIFTVRESLRIIAQTLNGLASAHNAGVVHRDIKPENILLDDRGRVKITDFGLARTVSQATVSTTGMLLGTAAYLPPETIENNEATPQGDLYSVGIMAWEMLAGNVPFLSDNPVTMVFKHVHDDVPALTSVCTGINPEVSSFITRLTMRDLNERPADASKALADLQALESHLSPSDWAYAKPETQDSNPTLSTNPPNPPMSPNAVQANASASTKPEPTPSTSVSSSVPESSAARPTSVPAVTTTSGTEPASATYNAEPQREADHSTRTASASQAQNRTLPTETLTTDTADADRTSAFTRASNGVLEPAVKATVQVKRKRHGKKLIPALVITLVLALAAGGFAWWYFLGPGSYWPVPKPESLACDNQKTCIIRDVAWKPYSKTLQTSSIPYHVTRQFSDTIKSGNIISTAPTAVGAKLSKRNHGKLAVVVSKGVRRISIPADIADPTSANGKDPIKTLHQAGFSKVFHNEAKDSYSETLPEGALQSINPEPGTTLAHNAKITVTLSKGPMPVSMPDVVGKDKGEAESAFSDAKLEVDYSEEFSDSVPAGAVISTSVKQGTQLHWGDSVHVVLSKGPETVTVPDVKGKSTDDATKTLEDLGLSVKVSAPLGDIAHTVRLQSIGAGKQIPVHDKDGNKTVITLTVI